MGDEREEKNVVLSLHEESVSVAPPNERRTMTEKSNLNIDDHEDILMNFSAMRKISDLRPHSPGNNTEQENGEEDLNIFIKAFSRKKFREKRSKMRSDEHSDRDEQSESESSLSDADRK